MLDTLKQIAETIEQFPAPLLNLMLPFLGAVGAVLYAIYKQKINQPRAMMVYFLLNWLVGTFLFPVLNLLLGGKIPDESGRVMRFLGGLMGSILLDKIHKMADKPTPDDAGTPDHE